MTLEHGEIWIALSFAIGAIFAFIGPWFVHKEKRLPDPGLLRCSFCAKQQDEVKKLIAGPKVFICNECVGVCLRVIEEQDSRENNDGGASNATPRK